jgi:soluble lytic murein transglycosylase
MRPALDPRRWIGVLLAAAKAGGPSDSVRIAQGATEGFIPGSEIAQMAFAVRDDYTSLMWLGGTTALWQMRDATTAANLFYNYAHAARTPMTRAKGYYWAGRAMDSVGQTNGAFEYYRWAAQFRISSTGFWRLNVWASRSRRSTMAAAPFHACSGPRLCRPPHHTGRA